MTRLWISYIPLLSLPPILQDTMRSVLQDTIRSVLQDTMRSVPEARGGPSPCLLAVMLFWSTYLGMFYRMLILAPFSSGSPSYTCLGSKFFHFHLSLLIFLVSMFN